MNRMFIATCLAGLFAVSATDADAQVPNRIYTQNATGMCQGATRLDERNLDKGVMYVINFGRRSVDVSCSMMTREAGQEISRVIVSLINVEESPANITCQLVPAPADFSIGWAAITKTVLVGALSTDRVEFFMSENADGSPFAAVNFECALPPGTGIGATLYFARESV